MIRSTPCECSEPGYCPRHRAEKSRQIWLACQRDQTLFEFFERMASGETQTAVTQVGLPQCQHRGLDVMEELPCELCGNRQINVPVFSCNLHQECTERRFGNSTERSRTIMACTTCPDYAPIDVSAPS